jgi:hypothetical protein
LVVNVIAPIVAPRRLLPLTRIERKRFLPFMGDVVVNEGTQVDGLDSVARASSLGQLSPIPLARYLHVKESAIKRHVLKHPGEFIQAQEIIASKPEYLGTLQRIYRAPNSGRIASFEGTWMTLDFSDKPFSLQALYRGTIKRVVPGRGVFIETVGALAQCAWGAGEAYGVLKTVVDAPSTMLMENMIDLTARGAVLLAGKGISDAAIRRAVKEHVAGLIVGGLHPQQKEMITSLKLPTLVTEGFGELTMSESVFQLLSSHEGEEVTLNGSVRPSEMRPEAFVPSKSVSIEGSETVVPAPLTARLGARVKMIAEPYLGAVGKLAAIIPSAQILEHGLLARVAEVEFDSGERALVPWENLELID